MSDVCSSELAHSRSADARGHQPSAADRSGGAGHDRRAAGLFPGVPQAQGAGGRNMIAVPLGEVPLGEVLGILDLLGVAIFALTGALLAARQNQTFVTMAFFALVTGVGGGTMRDLLIGAPVFWITDPWVAATCLVVALIAWFTPGSWWEGRLPEIGRASCRGGGCPDG